MLQSMSIYIGCSGYYYKEWKGAFYPEGLPSTKWLQYYARHFNTIEINSTFYRSPTLKSLAKWYNDTPADFCFTVKANKLFTHFKRLSGVDEELQQFYDIVMSALKEKVKCLLFQFPASVKYSEEMLHRVLSLRSRPLLHAIEFRDESWWRQDVYEAMHQAGLIFCNISLPGFTDIFVPDKNANYLRFHGKPVLYKSGYGKEGLEWWLDKYRKHPAGELFVYFNNTWFGEAIADARIFMQELGTS